ncbi:MotA/TolQ/ExbB proton channel family protein [Vibrio paucivorans]|uniref:MotA/TolQ/ExbB proton channel family protein n=1 Tax=Vibrio paucivorans TaxID=2829489 RepID=A0A9X3CDA4_9VIBR|nr:MotA/TolQ/ExbB proton channel family protein [Vibrio paucivorans]MCW8333653.1 MotA/TolQ/ExbB proton channel family protein [Vibrio paucivorans]
MNQLETLIYQFVTLFMQPVMALVVITVVYSLYALGRFGMELVQRQGKSHVPVLHRYAKEKNVYQSDQLELWIIKQLEPLRIVSRSGPMLGLVTTMIAIGPALVAMGEGEIDKVAQEMIVAFSASILALIAASITFSIMTVRRRWMLEDMCVIEVKEPQ